MECWLPFKDLSSSTCFLEERKEILKSITYRNVDYSLIFFIPYMNCPETFKSNILFLVFLIVCGSMGCTPVDYYP